MMGTLRNLQRLATSILVGATAVRLRKLLALRFQAAEADPLYYVWYAGLERLMVSSRVSFEEAVAELLALEKTDATAPKTERRPNGASAS